MERFYKMVEASNKRFPEGVKPFQMVTRLLEGSKNFAIIGFDGGVLFDSAVKIHRCNPVFLQSAACLFVSTFL